MRVRDESGVRGRHEKERNKTKTKKRRETYLTLALFDWNVQWGETPVGHQRDYPQHKPIECLLVKKKKESKKTQKIGDRVHLNWSSRHSHSPYLSLQSMSLLTRIFYTTKNKTYQQAKQGDHS